MKSVRMYPSMDNSSSESDSSIEDADEKKRLSEAVVQPFVLNKSTSFNTPSKGDSKDMKTDRRKFQTKPSLRPNLNDKASEDEAFTPGVQKFVASKLSEQLDREIELLTCERRTTLEEKDSGIKLFQSSKDRIKGDEDEPMPVQQRRKRQVSCSSQSSEDERLKEAAVSSDFIMRQSGVHKLTEERSPDPPSNNNDLDLGKRKQPTADKSPDTPLEINNIESVKRKKKKKKAHKEEIKVS